MRLPENRQQYKVAAAAGSAAHRLAAVLLAAGAAVVGALPEWHLILHRQLLQPVLSNANFLPSLARPCLRSRWNCVFRDMQHTDSTRCTLPQAERPLMVFAPPGLTLPCRRANCLWAKLPSVLRARCVARLGEPLSERAHRRRAHRCSMLRCQPTAPTPMCLSRMASTVSSFSPCVTMMGSGSSVASSVSSNTLGASSNMAGSAHMLVRTEYRAARAARRGTAVDRDVHVRRNDPMKRPINRPHD